MHGAAAISDLRVTAALEVLTGAEAGEVATRHDLDARLVRRWADQFLRAGVAAVRNEPIGDEQQARDRLLAAINHELRTPITKVRGYVSLLARDGLTEEQSSDLIERLHREFVQLDELLRRLGETTGASLGRIDLERQQVALGDLLAPMDGEVTGEVTVIADPQRLRTIIQDVVALAHDGPNTTAVTVQARQTGPWVEIDVIRHGDPFDPGRLAAELDPFSARAGHEDVTFGLHLAMALTVLHGGHLNVRRVDDHDRFTLRIPTDGPRTDEPDGEDVIRLEP